MGNKASGSVASQGDHRIRRILPKRRSEDLGWECNTLDVTITWRCGSSTSMSAEEADGRVSIVLWGFADWISYFGKANEGRMKDGGDLELGLEDIEDLVSLFCFRFLGRIRFAWFDGDGDGRSIVGDVMKMKMKNGRMGIELRWGRLQ